MSTHDLSEIYKKLRTELLTDSTLTDLLANPTNIWATTKAKFPTPAIVITQNAANPIGSSASFTGLWRPDLQFNILAVNPHDCQTILGRLVEEWTIPQNKTTAVTSDNFRMTALSNINSIDVGPVRLVDSDESVHLLASDWKAKVTKRST